MNTYTVKNYENNSVCTYIFYMNLPVLKRFCGTVAVVNRAFGADIFGLFARNFFFSKIIDNTVKPAAGAKQKDLLAY